MSEVVIASDKSSPAQGNGQVLIIRADAFHIPLKDECIQCVVTSPPYFNLRRYEGSDENSFGQEKTKAEYVQHTIEVWREVRRVLRPDGVVFWNIGDSYFRKNLCLIPERIVIAAHDDGWIVRDIPIWHKPNPVPESAPDRCTRSYELILMLTKSRKYFSNGFTEPAITRSPQSLVKKPNGKYLQCLYPPIGGKKHQALLKANLAGNKPKIYPFRHKRNVWSIPTKPHKEAHIAMFPEEIPEICIKAASKKGQTILDPFAGSGTTGIVAKKLGRNAVLLDISSEYVELMKERLRLPIDEYASHKKASHQLIYLDQRIRRIGHS